MTRRFLFLSESSLLDHLPDFRIHGQSLVTSFVYKSLSSQCDLVAYKRTSLFNPKRYVQLLATIASYSKHCKVIYFNPSRSLFGVLLELPLYLFFLIFQFRAVLHIHGNELQHTFNSPIIGGLLAAVVNSSVSDVIFPTSTAASRVSPFLPYTSIHVIPNPVLLSDIELPESPLVSSHIQAVRYSSVRFFWNSNLLSSKGILDSLHMFISLRRRINRPISLTVIGSIYGDSELSKEQLTEKLIPFRNDPDIYFLGATPYRDSVQLLAHHDIVLLPSYYATECQPLAIINAMSLSKYIIVSDTEIFHDLCRDYNKVYYSSRDPSSLLSASTECLSSFYSRPTPSDNHVTAHLPIGEFLHSLDSVLRIG